MQIPTLCCQRSRHRGQSNPETRIKTPGLTNEGSSIHASIRNSNSIHRIATLVVEAAGSGRHTRGLKVRMAHTLL